MPSGTATPVSILDWFDPTNVEHLKAYKVAANEGTWPPGFLPEGMTFPSSYMMMLASRLAELYVDHVVRLAYLASIP